jgi:hypothetical protein
MLHHEFHGIPPDVQCGIFTVRAFLRLAENAKMPVDAAAT